MRFRTILALVIVLLVAVFLFANWSVFAAPVRFYFVLGSIDIPLGVVMVALLALVALVMAIYVSIWQGGLLRDYRQQSKELQIQRTLADDAEASRFTTLTALLREEMAKQEARFDAAFGALQTELRDTEHSIAATLAQMDDRMMRVVPKLGAVP
jgi:uncharacterized integral membrane protein